MIHSTVLRFTAVATLAMVALSLQAQDGFERISTDTIEWNGHRFELAVVRESIELKPYGVTDLVNSRGLDVAVFEPKRMEIPSSRLFVAEDTVATLLNRFAQLAKNDSTIIMFSAGRNSPPAQIYNPITGLKTINADLTCFLHNQFLLRETDGIYGFSRTQNDECVAVKYSFWGDLLWEREMLPCRRHIGINGMIRWEGKNVMFSDTWSSAVSGVENDSVIYALIDAEKGELKYSWISSVSNPGLGEFKSFVGDDRFICSMGKEWVLYSLRGKCREIKRGKLFDERFVGGVGSFKEGQLLGFASGLTSEIQFVDIESAKTKVFRVQEVILSSESRFIEKNTILYKSCLRNHPHLIVKLID